MRSVAEMFPNLAKLKKDDGEAVREQSRSRWRGEEPKTEWRSSRAGAARRERSRRLPGGRSGPRRAGRATLKVGGPMRARRSGADATDAEWERDEPSSGEDDGERYELEEQGASEAIEGASDAANGEDASELAPEAPSIEAAPIAGEPDAPSLAAKAERRSDGFSPLASAARLVTIGMSKRGGKGATLVGLDIQPGYVAAVEADVNGVVAVKRALGLALPPDTMREGELLDPTLLADSLRELFSRGHFNKRVRVGLANQRVVVRTVELPPIEEGKELAAAVSFTAQDQIPMPLANAVLDFQPLGIVDTPAGKRQRVVIVAAQREMVERLVAAVTAAGLRPEAVDLSAFAMIRALHRPDDDEQEQELGPGVGAAAAEPGDRGRCRTLFLNVGGLTNLAIADGTTCRFTRAVGGGLESMASALAERRSIPLVDARGVLASFDLSKREARDSGLPGAPTVGAGAGALPATAAARRPGEPTAGAVGPEGTAGAVDPASAGGPSAQPRSGDAEVRAVIGVGLREIAGEVRNSLEYHRAQEGGGTVERVVVSGAALEMNGFASALEAELGFRLERRSVASARGGELNGTPAERLAVAAGLAVEEVSR
ncbi:MAG: pilus assembly protein PilM [Solirubrobacteraceae bacterium]